MINVKTTVDRDLLAVKQGQVDLEFVVEKHYEELFDFYLSNGEMPYDVAKCRDGDPITWMCDELSKELGL